MSDVTQGGGIFETAATGGFPLSPQQRRLWALHRADPAATWRTQMMVRLDGDLDAARLRAAIGDVVARYEILRTSFPCPPGMKEPLQVIGEPDFLWEHTSAPGSLGAAEREAWIESLWHGAAAAPPDLERGPALAASLVTLEPTRHLLSLRLPALCADAVSLVRLAAEVGEAYASGAGAEEPLQYADLASWQNELLDSSESEEGRAFWRRLEIGPALAFRLPFLVLASRPGHRPRAIDLPLPAGLGAALARRAEELGTPLSSLLLAGWLALLSRLAGEREIAVGVAFDGRSYDGLGEALGPLARSLPVAAVCSPDLVFSRLAADVQQRISEFYERQEFFRWEDLPGGPAPETGYTAAFDFIELPSRRNAANLGLTLERLSAGLERAGLRLSWTRREGELRGELHYDETALERTDVQRLAGQLATLLAGAAAAPETPLARLPVLTPDERRRLTLDLNDTARPLPEGPVHRQFEAWADRTPQAPALVFEEERLTFAELEERANRLAHDLLGLGVEPEVPVALLLPRSPEMVVAILAVLKAGGCYVPLDPGLPAERAAFLLAETAASVVVCLGDPPPGLAASGVRLVRLDVDTGELARRSSARPDLELPPESAAYVLFTSGSTGRPKGVVVEHRQLVSYIAGVTERLDLPPGASYATVSTFAADLGNTVVFPALTTGGCLHVIAQERLSDPEAMARYFELHAIDCLKIVPSHLEALQASARPERVMPRCRLVLGGEAPRREWIERLQALSPECRIVNHYGPTETTVGVLTHAIEPDGSRGVPLGRPLANARVYVLDPELEPAPTWAAGEIAIGGASVARGYLGRPDLTAERFLPDPWSERPGGRLYRTGDLGRCRGEGAFEFLGRIDDQVKIRGFRVEPGEIEALLREHAAVQAAAVLAREDRPGQRRLVAYAAIAPEGSATPAELTAFLAARLPDFMVPAAVVILPRLPLSSNGKVDRQRLPAPEEANPGSPGHVAPRTELERVLAEVWSEVLGVERIGVEDSFFQLGGDSIRSIGVRGRALERGLDFSVAELFEHPTIAQLAKLLADRAGEPAAAARRTVPFELVAAHDRERLPADVEDAYPLTRLQAGMLFHSELSPGTAIYHDIHSFHLRVRLDLSLLELAAARLAARHAVLRTSFDLSSYSEALQLVHRELTLPVRVFDLRGLPGDRQEKEIAAWLVEERRRPLDWSQAPLLGLFIHRRSEETLQFTLSFHHSIVDGWSTASLTAELFSQYLALLNGDERPAEPPLAIAFRDFVALERQALESEEHRRFWQRRLAGRSVTRLPRWAGHSGAAGIGEARALPFPVPAGVGRALKDMAESAGVPVKSVFLAAHLKALSGLSGESDVITGLISNGRPEEVDGERVLGLFLNTVPFRLALTPGRWLDLVRATFRAEQELTPYRRYPLAELQRAEGGEPLFETAFNYVHYHVYHGLVGAPGLTTLGQTGYEETNFPFEANFALSLADASVLFWLSYRTSDLTREQCELIAGHYLAVMRSMAADPEARHAAFSPLSGPERHQLLIEWNDTGRDWELEPTAWDLLLRQAVRTPQATAVIWEGERLSYGELVRRTEAAAARLAAVGVAPGTVVAVLAGRGLDFWLAALSVLAAGGAYLPLEPNHPAERQARIVARSGAPLAVVGGALLPGFAKALAALIAPPLLLPLADLLGDGGAVAPVRRATPADLAYVIYTSGSTGEPKGVMVEHRGMLNHLRAKVEDLGLTASDIVAQTASQCFDISVWQLLAPLLVGAAVHILPDEVAHEPRALLDVVRRGEVTILETVPSLLRLLLDEIEPQGAAALSELRWMIPTGEALAPELCRRWLAISPVPLLNAFGPTECSDDVSHHRIDVPPAADAASVPIGRPVANLRLYVVDSNLLPVPLAVAGELCVAGIGVGRGYLGEPARTAASFVPDPFSAQPGARLYRTGDLGRWTPEGRLEFLGRLDHQVKIRGHRIELGEIETALMAYPSVRQAVVVAREEPAGVKSLAAYLVPAGGGVQLGMLRAFLEDRLPEAMVPSVFVVLGELPLTPNGKLDRSALPAPVAGDRLDAGRPYAAPRTGEEEILAGVWEDVLRREQVGIHDDFFELGGDSLSATRVVSRLRKLLGLDFPLRTLFDAPTVAGFAAEIGAFRRSGRGLSLPPLQPAARGSARRLSFAQERLWFIDQLEPGSSAYNIHRALRLGGSLDDRILEICLREILHRHEALRTAFVAVGGVPSQVVCPIAGPILPIIDLQLLPEPERAAEARRLATAEAYRSFDLARAPLVRSTLLRLDTDDHVVLVTMHHIVSDAWSVGLFIEELVALYEAFSASRPSPLPPLPVQYADFAEWQRQWLQGEVLESHLGYWRERLAGGPVLELHTDRPRPAMQSLRGADQKMALSGDLTREIKLLARSEGVTLFMVLLAALQVLLRRYGGQEDVVVGTPVANRGMPELERLIGFFINTLALRTDLGGALSFRTLLGRVREVSLGAHAHQDLPFEKVVEVLQPERDLSRSPLYQVMLILQNAPFPTLRLPDLRLRPWEVEQRNTRFDLEIMLSESPRGLHGSVTYATGLFDPPTISRLALHLEILLRGAVSDPDRLLSELPLLSEGETWQLREWNDTAVGVPREALIHDLIAARAAERPDAIALVEGECQITYGELNRRADRIAGELCSLGVGPEAVVGLLMERSVELVIGALAVLKAGGAYLPLDPSSPRERLTFMLRDAGVSALLAKSPGLARPLAAGVPVLSLDRWLHLESPHHDEPARLTGADHLAYVIYTSGSTGLPKGVEVSHRALLNLAFWHRRAFELTSDDRATLVAGVAFDASVWEIWPYLSAGSSLHLPDEETRMSPARLRDWLVAQETTLSFLPTPLAESLFALEWQGRPALRALLVGGDRLHLAPPSLPFQVVNNYGPTENAVVATSGMVTPGDVNPAIGRPLDNVKVHVLDAALQPVPVGVAGGLYISGESLARGYRGRPELTAAKFLPDPFSFEPGSRLYETGDLVRLQPSGAVDFLGRIDEQLKIRGFRVEPGEVEAALEAHPDIQTAVVVGRESSAGDLSLVAYMVTERREPSTSALRAFLKERVPEYMVPAAFVRLDAFPLTANGKVDRRALPELETAEVGTPGDFAAPGNPIEEVLAGIWEEVLRVAPVGLRQSFFDLGGHSLLATQIVSRIRSVFGVEIPVRTLFEEPTVAGLARAVEAARRADTSPELPDIEPAPRDSVLPLSFAQARLWFLDQLDPGNSTYNLHVAVHLEGPLDVAVLARSFTEVLRRHEVLRTTFVSLDGLPSQAISPLSPVTLPLVDLCGLPAVEAESKARELAAAEARRPFELAHGPLLRIVLVRLGTGRHVVLATMHHIVSDGWSMGILIREVAALYAASRAGKGSPLPDLPIQYGDYALWQQRWLQGEVLARELESWRRRLGGAPPVLEVPTDRPRPAVQRFRGRRVSRRLPAVLGRDLKALGRRQGLTLFMTLLAAFKALLCRYTGQEDIVVGSPIAGRNRAETEGLIGFFVNTLVLRTDLSGDPPFLRIAERVRETSLEAHSHQDLPFEKLVEDAQPERSLSHSPLFQVLFVLQNAVPREVVVSDLAMVPMETQSGAAKFDLSLDVAESEAGQWLRMDYDVDLFDAPTVARLLGHLETLLAAIAADPGQRLGELPLLSEGELQQILREWSWTPFDQPCDLCLHEMFERQVERTPDAVALVFEGERLTYRDLDRRANRLARALRSLGVGPDVRVGLCVERAPEMVWGILGVLKAGGAYVPLDPEYPDERLAFLIHDAGPQVLLTQERLVGRTPWRGAPPLCLDMPAWTEGHGEGDDERPASHVTPDHLAYVIYTSGSTGLPKGSLIAHRGVANQLQWRQRCFPLGPADRVLQTDSFSFDPSLWQIFWPLSTGARLVLLRPGGNRDSSYLVRLMAEEGITVAGFVPSLLQVVLEEPELDRCRRLRHLFCGGEPLRADLQHRFFTRVPAAELHNVYGPTEASIDATDATFRAPEEGRIRPIAPIGRAIGNKAVYVVDRCFGLAPVGVPGELCVGGVGLARGYLGRPELTAERFTPDPFAAGSGARLYRTGDLVRLLVDGAIEFLGRIDHQVKIRGFRIELGEVEAALGGHPRVKECVVEVREETPGARRLIAYVVPDSTAPVVPATAELRRFLEAKLPQHMIPSVFVILEALPLSPNGKVDRRALPAPGGARPELRQTYVAPRTSAERELAAIWSQVLGIDRVGVEDNFFDLGGDSILSIQIVAKAGQAGLRITPRDVFQHQTVAELAAAASHRPTAVAAQGMVTGELPLTPIQRWFFEREAAEPHHFNQSVLFEIRRPLSPAVLEGSLAHLLAHHDALRLRFAREESGWRQRIVPGDGRTPFAWIDLSTLPVEVRSTALTAAAASLQTSLDLVRGPLVRLTLFNCGEDAVRLLWIVHHLAVDGVSWRILLEDLGTACRQLERGEPVALPPKTTSFLDWAERLREHARAAATEAELEFWLAQDPGCDLSLPADFDAGDEENTRESAATVTVALAAEDTRALLQDVPGAYNTQINDALLTALVRAFTGWTGQPALLSELEGHGREDLFPDCDLSRTVGWFTTAFPVFLDLSGAEDPGDALRTVKERLRSIPRQGLGYGLLRYLCAAEAAARLSSLPSPSVSFNYLGQFDQILDRGTGFVVAPESAGPEQSSKSRRPHRIEITCQVANRQLQVAWRYSRKLHRRATIEKLADDFLAELRHLIAHCQSPEAGGYTPSDFPLAGLDGETLTRLTRRIAAVDAGEE